ncbi:MAG: glutamate formimidoyltransferase [Dysgonamonadaceae bacterium]|jgi:glutamate formiminotransferase|nr:glutamate formimidoyltransferase [Dysgonamonadaceae bacterium]
MHKIVECVPNFSEGRDAGKIAMIVDAFRGKEGVKLLDYSNDTDHNRMVVTVIGAPEAVKLAMLEATRTAISVIDLNGHRGQHPRIGAVDVVPFIPVANMTMDEAVALSKEVAREMAQRYDLPVYLYEKSASAPHRENLAAVRKGAFEGLTEKMKLPEWNPDYGPATPHPTAGAVAVGARNFLIAFNVNLNTTDPAIAEKIAKKIRFIGGGLRYCKAIGIHLKEKNLVQVSVNLTDPSKTRLYQIVEMIRFEAARYGVTIAGSELIGLIPLEAVLDTMSYYLGLENLSPAQVLESHLPM